MKVLVVEDSREKAASITGVLVQAGFDDHDIVVVPDIFAAKTALQGTVFVLLVLDMQIPHRYDKRASDSGGMELLRWMHRRQDRVCVPCVVALSAYELKDGMASELVTHGVIFIRYSMSDISWRDSLAVPARRMAHLIGQSGSGSNRQCGVVILTAVQIEHDHARAVFGAEQPFVESGESWCMGRADEAGDVVIGQTAQMGMPAAAVLATRAYYTWRPRLMLMVGICGGVKGETDLGDLVVSDPVWDHGSGKLTARGILHPDPRPVPLGGRMKQIVRSLLGSGQESKELNKCYELWPADKPRSVPRVLVAPSVSGAAVVQSEEAIKSVQEHSRKVAAIDMENYGVYFAMESLGRGVDYISIKAVVDFADAQKNDHLQAYGARMSCEFARLVIRRWFECSTKLDERG